jgi:hypothetical protein
LNTLQWHELANIDRTQQNGMWVLQQQNPKCICQDQNFYGSY